MQQPPDVPVLLSNRFADATPPETGGPSRDRCACVGYSAETRPETVHFHPERQDTTAPGWLRLLHLIDEAAADGRESFTPFVEMTSEQRRQVVTLPPSIGTLTAVRHLVLYGTNLVRIPPEIGAMSSLEVFEPYTSHRLHWYPYELTRCTRLRDSTVSTRVLYGNVKHRPPFPALRPVTAAAEATFGTLDPGVWGTEAVRTCSVCDQPIGQQLHQVWISLRVGTDVLPFLVNACSPGCIDALPQPARDHVQTAHTGGPGVVQPPDYRTLWRQRQDAPDSGSGTT
ncbi:leucine-rich repeat domain-containing protein [Micromonospora cathayae]|uniref:Leucine-rich repeat domain-containing protein n=1 Tax=Micromonospora cathayae TaxID=3028804 RepID=A0ABY7ZLE6_9ACTN|nr:leucine-rich repeat domain-containing protein [Micromonospora sp. HUAS 3]WDZ82799.1 leucine-rich repeat domain-containing protein [Micromonospora sp. HUAS 3]